MEWNETSLSGTRKGCELLREMFNDRGVDDGVNLISK